MHLHAELVYLLTAYFHVGKLLLLRSELRILTLELYLNLPYVLIDDVDSFVEWLENLRNKASKLVLDIKRCLCRHYTKILSVKYGAVTHQCC